MAEGKLSKTERVQENATKVEQGIETIIFASRWLQAPIYMLLILVLFVFVYDMGREVFNMLGDLNNYTGYKLIVAALALCDAALVANLIVVVIISGYENFVSKIDVAHDRGEPTWIKQLSPTGVKMKIAGSIVAISSITLLKQFLEINTLTDRELFWYVIVHITFVISAAMIAFVGILEKKVSSH